MSVYNYRDKPAYRQRRISKDYSKNPHILKWWNKSHDKLLVELIERYQWHWFWHITDEVLAITPLEIIEAWKIEDPACSRHAWYNALMYFARSRAESLKLTRKIRKPKWKVCLLCNQRFVEDSLPSPLTRRLGIDKLNFCSLCLKGIVFADSGSDSLTKEEIIDYLNELVNVIERVPPQNFGEGINDFDDTDTPQRLRIFRVLQKKPTINRVKELFGSWFIMLVEAGILENGTIKRVMGYQCLAKDGHVCFSLGEKTIDDFLYKHNIPHEKEQRYPEGNFRNDFLVNEVFIEYFGLVGNAEYDLKIKKKRQICKKHGIRLISLYPKDLLNVKKLTKKLKAVIS
jgi:hypothetical protein